MKTYAIFDYINDSYTMLSSYENFEDALVVLKKLRNTIDEINQCINDAQDYIYSDVKPEENYTLSELERLIFAQWLKVNPEIISEVRVEGRFVDIIVIGNMDTITRLKTEFRLLSSSYYSIESCDIYLSSNDILETFARYEGE